MKKMTYKEFKSVLESVGIFSMDYERIINTIICANKAQAVDCGQYGCFNAAKRLQEQADELYNILDNRGYYDKLKMEVEK